MASQVVRLGVAAPFILAAVVYLVGAVAVAVQATRLRSSGVHIAAPAGPAEVAELEAEGIAESNLG